MTSPQVVLIGPPGAGKTVIGKALARLLALEWRDTDSDIEAVAGKTVADIFIESGEPFFRELERTAVTAALESHAGVLSLGGGAVMDRDTQAQLFAYRSQGGEVVFLDISLNQVANRIGFNASRPLLLGNPRKQWFDLMAQRRPIYESLATLQISTDHLSPKQVAREIATKCGWLADNAAQEGNTDDQD